VFHLGFKEKFMKIFLLLVVASLFSAHAFAAKTYQVTGPVLEVSDTKIVVQKGKEKFEIARSPDTKITGDVKVGSKVTVNYSMSAEAVEAKGDAKKTK
jgi:hypothetical protein